jgi:hypothetical protein
VRGILKGVIFDHTTILLPLQNQPLLTEIRDLITELKTRNLRVGIFSTHPKDIDKELAARSLPRVDIFLTLTDIPGAKKKGSPLWIEESARRLALQPFELLYIGSDKQDWLTAIHAATFYLHARWVQSPPSGITAVLSAGSPGDVLRYVTHFLLLRPRWEYRADDPKIRLSLRSLLGANANLPATSQPTFRLQDVFTYGLKVTVGQWSARDLLMMHAISSLYVEGRVRPHSYFAVYPGSRPGKISGVLREFVAPASSLFHGYFKEDLLMRGRPAIDSSMARSEARKQGRQDDPVDFSNQTNTVHVNPEYRDGIKDRSVIIFDDFTTTGMSLEWARNLLYAAGAREIILLTIGKYPKPYVTYVPRRPDIVEPFGLKDYDIARDFGQEQVRLEENPSAGMLLAQSFDLWRKGRPFA